MNRPAFAIASIYSTRRQLNWSYRGEFSDKADAAGCRSAPARWEKGGTFSEKRGRFMMRLAIACGAVILVTGCGLWPDISHQPTIHNPFPQLTKVAVAPFINVSAEATVDGRQFGIAYFEELQAIPGYEVVPVGTVETAMRDHHVTLDSPADVRRLAQILGVDAVVIGVVTDYCAYYPPRCGLQVEWYAANPCFHPIPPGYGLPWGTPAEEDIPESLVLETEMSLAREQLKTQTPGYQAPVEGPAGAPIEVPAQRTKRTKFAGDVLLAQTQNTDDRHRAVAQSASDMTGEESRAGKSGSAAAGGRTRGVAQQLAPPGNLPGGPTAAGIAGVGSEITLAGLPADWPDPRGLVPPPPSCRRPACIPSNEPVLRHTRIYSGTDPDFTAALSKYSTFRDDARFGGWSGYLQRSEDFIRFCCHKHIAEMLTARGGAGTTRVLWRWPNDRYTF
jgi:hypothetical protein